MELSMQPPTTLDHGQAHLPWPIGKHHHVSTKLGGRRKQNLPAPCHRIDAPIEGMLRDLRANFDARLFGSRGCLLP